MLAQGNSKSLVIGHVPHSQYHRRIDFLYTMPEQYPFAVLYFTGSKDFNTAMRTLALKNKLSLNEHCFTDMKTQQPLDKIFYTERDIFDFMNMEYREPDERIDENSIKRASPAEVEQASSPEINEFIKLYGFTL